MAFKEDFEKLMLIEKLYKDSCKLIDKRVEQNLDVQVAFEQKRHEERIRAEMIAQDLLAHYSEHSEAQQYIQQILQDIQKDLHLLPEEIPRIIEFPPNFNAEEYGDYFSDAHYQRLIPYCKLAYLSEQNGIPEEHALKLSVMFDEPTHAMSYIQKNLTQNTLAIHDACLLVLPEVHKCDFTQWKKLIKRNINDATFRGLLSKAAEIEVILKQNKLEKGKKINRNLIKSKKAEIQTANSHLKVLKRKHGSLTETEEEQYQNLIDQLATLYIELFEISAGLELKEADLTLLTACNEYYMQQTQGAYKYMLEHGLTKQNFIKFSELERIDNDDDIPNIKIDGEDFGYPGFYLMKVPVMDEMQAARAACFGKLTNCCQSLSGEAGQPCTIHGLTSRYGGFYVLCEGDINDPKVEDRVVGQSWAWRSESGAIVLDSIETSDENDDTVTIKLFEQLGKKIVEDNGAYKVVCGANSGISSKVGVHSTINKTEVFIDYQGYSDSQSQSQRVISDYQYPFYGFDKDELDTNLTEEIIQQLMQDEQPLITSSFICSLLNWAMIEPEDDQRSMMPPMPFLGYEEEDQEKYRRQHIINFIKSIANSYNRLNELDEIIDSMSRYLSTELTDEETLSLIDQKTFATFIIDKQGNSSLMAEVKNGHNNSALRLMELDADIKVKDNNGQSLLMIAAQNGLDEVVLKLITLGANVNDQNREGKTALIMAIENGHHKIALDLIASDANINALSNYGEIALMSAAQNGSKELVSTLIDMGSDINATDYLGRSVLSYAMEGKQSDIVFRLMDLGANPYIVSKVRNTSLMDAAQNGLSDVISRLIKKGVFIDAQNNEAKTALYMAIKEGQEDAALMLINSSVDINAIKNNPYVLACASEKGLINIALKLISMGIDVNQRNEENESAFMLAVINGHRDIALKLIELDADVHVKNFYGNALIYAAGHGFTDVVTKILEKGVDVNTLNYYNKTALVEAIEHEHSDTALMLIEAGANVNKTDNSNTTPLMLASLKGLEEVAFKLIEQGADETDTVLTYAVKGGSKKIVLKLIDLGADINRVEKYGSAPLTDAIANDYIDIALLLIEKGANVNVKGNYLGPPLLQAVNKGQTAVVNKLIEAGANIEAIGYDALIAAVENGHDDIVEKLLEANVNPNTQDKYYNNTALMKAAGLGHQEVVLQLIQAGAAPDLKNIHGGTALMEAVKNGFPKIARILIELGADVSLKDDRHRTALDIAHEIDRGWAIALENQIQEVNKNKVQTRQHLLFSNNSDPTQKLKKLIINDDPQKLLALMKRKHYNIDEYIEDEDGNHSTLLMHACEQGALNTVRALLENGANVNAHDEDQATALFYAVDCESENKLDIIKLLIKYDTNVVQKDLYEEDALERAKDNNSSSEIIDYLRHAKFDDKRAKNRIDKRY